MKRIYDIKKYVNWLPDLHNIGEHKHTFGRLLPKGLKNYYYIEDIKYNDGMRFIDEYIKEGNIFCYRSIRGFGGIFEGDDYIIVERMNLRFARHYLTNTGIPMFGFLITYGMKKKTIYSYFLKIP